ncbi:hypothetical protein NSMM_490022 [Nitrosomonas mobilis]|uniref:Uncharacterized protein n=1 Tax=Nitrosomonas mobilis TaxID=51642 RepID=A0A1G5SG10_9PROT|nr:hypothetical protein NSMM_490022 [Nitrosomonas mobilis]
MTTKPFPGTLGSYEKKKGVYFSYTRMYSEFECIRVLLAIIK